VKLLSWCTILFALFAIGCPSEQKKPPKAATPAPAFSLVGTEWILADLAGTPVIVNSNASIAFPEAGRVAGNFGPLANTRMACMDGGVSAQEDAYLKVLGAATRYEYREPDLLIYATGYDKSLRFTRAPAAAAL
jgi:heat shock protein HslJ